MNLQCFKNGCKNKAVTKKLCSVHYRVYHEKDNQKKGKICSVNGCNKGIISKGLCINHYQLKKFPAKVQEKRNQVKGKICKMKGCERGVRSNGYCNNHASRMAVKENRKKIFEYLGQDKCQICGFSDKRAFSFDHIFNDGYLDKKELSKNSSNSIWIKYAKDPELTRKKLQVLCMNCNQIKEVERKRTRCTMQRGSYVYF